MNWCNAKKNIWDEWRRLEADMNCFNARYVICRGHPKFTEVSKSLRHTSVEQNNHHSKMKYKVLSTGDHSPAPHWDLPYCCWLMQELHCRRHPWGQSWKVFTSGSHCLFIATVHTTQHNTKHCEGAVWVEKNSRAKTQPRISPVHVMSSLNLLPVGWSWEVGWN